MLGRMHAPSFVHFCPYIVFWEKTIMFAKVNQNSFRYWVGNAVYFEAIRDCVCPILFSDVIPHNVVIGRSLSGNVWACLLPSPCLSVCAANRSAPTTPPIISQLTQLGRIVRWRPWDPSNVSFDHKYFHNSPNCSDLWKYFKCDGIF